MVLEIAASIAAGLVFGFALAAPPGPMNAIIAEESVMRGWRAGVRAGLGAMSADLCFLALALAGALTVIRDRPLVRGLLFALGGMLMLSFAVGAIRETRHAIDATVVGSEEAHGFRKAFVLALTNPYQILFWLTVGVGLLEPTTHDLLVETPHVGDALAGVLVVHTGSVALIAGVFVGIGVWVLGFPAALVRARRQMERLAPVVTVGSSAVLGGFGVAFLWQAVRILNG